MAKFSKSENEFLVVFLGREKGEEKAGFATVFVGLLAMAIVMIIFVGLINDLEKKSMMISPKQPSGYTPRNVI